jgi:hypothetical protein
MANIVRKIVEMKRRLHFSRLSAGLVVSILLLLGATLSACSSNSTSTASSNSTSTPKGHVLLVGSFNGVKGQYATVQAAVNAAKPGDWILIGPGDYHEDNSMVNVPTSSQQGLGENGGVLITTPDLHLRGMNRNTVVIDGTKPGSPECSSAPQDQNLGPIGPNGKPMGENGIDIFETNNTWVENLTVCNYLSGSGGGGNEIWWDGGSGTGKIGLSGYWGSYLTATSTYYGPDNVDAGYGIFANSAAGPASWNQIYASNFNDSGMYVGACQQVCDITINHAWMEYNALGYSGTNSGGAVVIENSQFDNNQDGFDTNTQIGSDPPPPQNGDCPDGKISPITHTRSCWVFMHNYVHNNNNPNVPETSGYASAGPTGTGMTLSGGRNDTVMDNVFENNGAWGILFVPFPDSDKPFKGVTCANSGGFTSSLFPGCIYNPENDALINNTFKHNGFFGNPSNGDYGQIVFNGGLPQNCYSGNVAPDGSTPSNLEKVQSKCGTIMKQANLGGSLFSQVLCDTHFLPCPAGANYPTVTQVTMKPLPKNLPTMPNPCQNVPSNSWCKNGKPIS